MSKTTIILGLAAAIGCITIGLAGITFHPETTWDCRFDNCLAEVHWTAFLLFIGLYLAAIINRSNHS